MLNPKLNTGSSRTSPRLRYSITKRIKINWHRIQTSCIIHWTSSSWAAEASDDINVGRGIKKITNWFEFVLKFLYTTVVLKSSF
jgi:hypothetical protein